MPADWSTGTLADLCSAVDYGFTASASPNPSAGPKFLRITDIRQGHLRWDDVPHVEIPPEKLASYMLADGDIVVARTGAFTGANAYVVPPVIAVFASYLVRLKAGPRLCSRFAYYFMQSQRYRDHVAGVVGGSAQPNASAKALTQVEMPMPPLDEQHRIAAVLGALDDKIELNRRMSETLFEIVHVTYMQSFRPRGLEDDPYDGDHPSDIWRTMPIARFTRVIYGAPFASSAFNSGGVGTPLLRIRDLKNHQTSVWTTEVHPSGHLVQPGDIVVGMDGEFRRYLWTGEAAWLNQRVCHLEPLDPVPRAYLHEALVDPLATIERGKTGTTVIHLGKRDIDQVRLLWPGESALRKFGERVEPMLDRATAASAENRALAAIREALLPKLVSGEIRITDAERVVAEVT